MFRPATAGSTTIDAPQHKPDLQTSKVQGGSTLPQVEWDPYSQYVLDTQLAAELAILRAQINSTLPQAELLELIRDTMAATLVPGAGVAVTHDDAANTIRIDVTVAGGGSTGDAEFIRDTMAGALLGASGVTDRKSVV